MEKPNLASQDVFKVMLSCWETNPEARPLFDVLEQKFDSYLEESVKEVGKLYFRYNE